MSAMLTMWSRVGFSAAVASLLLVATASAQTGGEPIDIELVSASGVPGDSVEIGVVMHAEVDNVAGIQIDIDATAPLTIVTNEAGRPDCWRNTDLNKDFTVYSFPFRDAGQWNRMRAMVLSLTNVDPIPDGSLLFTCRVDIDADAEPGEYPLVAMRLGGSTPRGVAIPAVSSGGTVLVADPAEGSVALVEGTNQASGGCAIGTSAPGTASVMLLVLPLVLWLASGRNLVFSSGVRGTASLHGGFAQRPRTGPNSSFPRRRGSSRRL